MKRILTAALAILWPVAINGHGPANRPDVDESRRIDFPDTATHQTLVVDLHTHTVFSDGHVWPRIRIEEALRDGLDAIAITDHLEWQPHLADIPHTDRNRSYDEAVSALPAGADLIVLRGCEITRDAPAGHMNAVFSADNNQLLKTALPVDPSDTRAYYTQAGLWPPQEAVDAANEQGAFVFWNHSWSNFTDGITVAPEFHRNNAVRRRLHGIEVANGDTYSEAAFQIALDLNLAVIGVSDVHNLIDWDYRPHEGGHRPVTLVFANERSVAGIREALLARRTVAWFGNLLIGRPTEVDPLLAASLSVVDATYQNERDVLDLTIVNRSDARFQLKNLTPYTFEQTDDLVAVPPQGNTKLSVRTGSRAGSIELRFEVVNALVAPKEHAVVTLTALTAQ